jgi:pimeloyl-ACP methyl ester carboxylesterase
MPRIDVPLVYDDPSGSRTISVSYRVCGSGPVIVALIPGLMVPQSMYEALAEFLASSGRFTAVSIDNRGIGESDCPPAALLHRATSTGYTVTALALDAWAVVDCVRADRRAIPNGASDLQPEIAVVGHSMGGMVAQRMILQRPREVRFGALLSTHAGGLWNMIPTTSVLLSAIRVALNRFDAKILAVANLDHHFTPRFLDQFVAPAPAMIRSLRKSSSGLWRAVEAAQGLKSAHDLTSAIAAAVECGIIKRRRRRDIYFARYLGHDFDWVSDLDVPEDIIAARAAEEAAQRSVEHVQAGTASCSTIEETALGVLEAPRSSVQVELKRLINEMHRGKHAEIRSRFKGLESSTISTQAADRRPSPGAQPKPARSRGNAVLPAGHFSVVLSHSLSRAEACALAKCHRMHTVVIAGADDRVITPWSSWTLARAIGAAAYVEIPGAHFIFDERSAQVNHLIGLGLSAAFFPDKAAAAAYPDPCTCQWCGPIGQTKEELESSLGFFSICNRLASVPSAIKCFVSGYLPKGYSTSS